MFVRLACIEALIDEINHVGRVLPWICKTMSNAAWNVEKLGASCTQDKAHCVVVSRGIFACIEKTDEQSICRHYEPAIFLIVVKVERLDSAWKHLRESALLDLEVRQHLEIAVVIQSDDFGERTAVIDEHCQIDELNAVNRWLLGVVLHAQGLVVFLSDVFFI